MRSTPNENPKPMGIKHNTSAAREVVLRYLHENPKLPRHTLSRLILKEHPKLFATFDQCRSMVRYYTGSMGSAKRAIVSKEHGTIRAKGASGDDPWEEMIPESWTEPIVPFEIPTAIRSLLVLSDIHVPYHDIAALKAAITYGIAAKPDAVLLNGDTLDFYAISDHERDPRKINWVGELEAGRQVLRMVRRAFPNVPIYFKEGNHEFRMERHLMKHAPILIGMQEFELATLMRMGEVGIEHIRNKRMVYAGALTIGHGDEWKGAGGVNPARWTGLRAKESAMVGHFHRVSEHVDRTVRGSVRGWWSLGCLCELQPAYIPYNEWSHGFAIVHLNPDGSFEVDNKKVIDGKVR